jgi:hypothetical protein
MRSTVNRNTLSMPSQLPLIKMGGMMPTVGSYGIVDTGEKVDAEADNVLINGVLASHALLSFHIAAVPFNATGWRMAVYGSKGTIIASTKLLPQITPITLVGAQGSEPLTELPVPERLSVVPAAVPEGPPRNIGQLYVRMAEAIREGKGFDPNFEDALEVHKLPEEIQRSSDEGRAVKLVPHQSYIARRSLWEYQIPHHRRSLGYHNPFWWGTRLDDCEWSLMHQLDLNLGDA